MWWDLDVREADYARVWLLFVFSAVIQLYRLSTDVYSPVHDLYLIPKKCERRAWGRAGPRPKAAERTCFIFHPKPRERLCRGQTAASASGLTLPLKEISEEEPQYVSLPQLSQYVIS